MLCRYDIRGARLHPFITSTGMCLRKFTRFDFSKYIYVLIKVTKRGTMHREKSYAGYLPDSVIFTLCDVTKPFCMCIPYKFCSMP